MLFKIGLIDQRPRLKLLGGFALVNIGIMLAAAGRKRIHPLQRKLRAASQVYLTDHSK